MKPFLVTLALWCAVLCVLMPAQAATFAVDRTDDAVASSCSAAAGDCTLRGAITAANSAAGDDAITFDANVFAAPRKTITLNGTQLPDITTVLSITAPAAGLAISGNNLSRVFYLTTAANLTLTGLTITGGNVSTAGGGIVNNGTLLLDSCTLTGNNAGTAGGAIYSNTNLSGLTLTLRNCTLSGNSASSRGGGIFNTDGLTVLDSCTVTGNTAPAGSGSGIASFGDNVTRTEVRNSIIAGNTATDVDFVSDTANSFQSNGYNLIGDGNATGNFNQTNDVVIGNTNPGLAALADNGGPTQTRALLLTSPAYNTGNTTLTVDQRGLPRPFGVADDKGAFELDVQSGSTYVVNQIADSDDGSCTQVHCTLREAINAANNQAGDDAITFDASVFAAPRKTITLNGTQLPNITTVLSITAPSAGVVLSGNNQSRVFNVTGSANLTLSGLTISGGNADFNSGGGIFNSGTLLLDSCTLSGNSANDGGAINSNTNLSGLTLTLRNCTLSGNTTSGSGTGGAIYNEAGLTILDSCTVTGNTAALGGGIASYGNDFTRTEVRNSIISGNTNTDVALFLTATNSFQSNGYNLIGDGNTNNFNQTGDVTGNANPGLGPLAENGGKTPTRALLPSSPALNSGNTTLTVDQRGLTRPIGTGDDKGAFEAVFAQIGDASLTEGNSGTLNMSFAVTLSTTAPVPLQFTYYTANGGAKSGSDFNGNALSDSDGATPGTLIIPAGQLTGTINVPIFGDTLNEADEIFYLFIANPNFATITRTRGVGTIQDNDAAPSITVDNATVVEGNAGGRFATFVLHLSAPCGQVVKVTAQSANGTATAPGDYTALPPTVISFTTGSTSAIARVLVQGDVLDEPNENLFLNLSTPINATISDNQAIASITDDDNTPSLTINDVSIAEGDSGTKVLTFTVSRTGQSANNITVNYYTANGTANSASDYIAATGTLTFLSGGAATQTISVTINGDALVEGDEVFYMFIAGATNAAIGRARGVGTLTNDDVSG